VEQQTSITLSYRARARTAAELLFGRLAGDRSPPRHIVVPTRLV